MNIKDYIPTVPQIVKEGIIVVASTLIAAWVLSKIPAAKKFVNDNSLTVNNSTGSKII